MLHSRQAYACRNVPAARQEEGVSVAPAHRGGVVHDEEAFQGPPQGGEVLHEEGHARAALAGHAQAGVPVQAVRKEAALRIQDVQQRLRIALQHTWRVSLLGIEDMSCV